MQSWPAVSCAVLRFRLGALCIDGPFLLEATTMSTETYFTPREAAEYLRSSTSTLAKARLTRRGPIFVRIGRAVRYRKSDIDAWMSASVARHIEQSRRAPTQASGGHA
jgi:excisionase family DNA binding protein